MKARKAILSLVVAVQFGIPLYYLTATPHLSRWSWQMYSREPRRDKLVVIDPEGRMTTVKPDEFFGCLRRDMDYADRLESHLTPRLEPGWKIERRSDLE